MTHRLIACCAALAVAFGVAAPAVAANDRNTDVIVVLDDDRAPGNHHANKEQAAAVARDHGVAPSQTYGTTLFGFAASVPEARLSTLVDDPRVDYVEPDREVRALGELAPWGVTRIGLDSVDRSTSNTGAGLHVYVLDTGIDADHPDLAANLGNGYAVEGCRGGSCLAAWDDDHGHGTHVAGTVGAVDNERDVIGVAPAVTLHAVKVLDKTGSGSRSGVIAGIDWMANEVAGRGQTAVANMSLGGTGSKTGTCSSPGFVGTDAYHTSICNAARTGTIFAVAAGNSGADATGAVPAAYDDAVITVSATQEGDDWPSWSNWGDEQASWTSVASAPVTAAAPGRSVVSTKLGGGTTAMSGTSMAAPHVVGALALYLAANPQAPDYTAFANARSAVLSEAETTSAWTNTSGNRHDESFLDVRTWAPLSTSTDPGTEPAPSGVTLTATGYKVKGVKHADLGWSGATTTHVDVYVDGTDVDTTANDGAFTLSLNSKGGGTHVFTVCESRSTTCSPDVSVTY